MRFSTKAIHEGFHPDPTTGALMPPIYMTSTYEQAAPGVTKGYDYTRAGNPNFTTLEQQVAVLEKGRYATAFSSGLGALTAVASTLKSGDTVCAMGGLYGGTFRLFSRVFANFGVQFRVLGENDSVEEALRAKPKILLFETPTNPLLRIYDIAVLAALAKKNGVVTVVDNTFASPYFQNPLELGADIVWHSCTKYLGGHSDVIGGIIVTNDEGIKKSMDFARMAIGVNPSPFDTWLLARSIKTLALRMERHQENAFAVARFLERHPAVERVYYPGLEGHPGHEVAKRQMRGFGGVVSVEFGFDLDTMKTLISSFRYFALAESLGGVESLVCHPATMTHASIPREERLRSGLSDGLVRLSIGVEDVEDLLEDLARIR